MGADGTPIMEQLTDSEDSAPPKWRSAGPLLSNSEFYSGPAASMTNVSPRGEFTRTWEADDDYALIVTTMRKEGVITGREIIRLTVSGDTLLRERKTVESRRPDGTRSFVTSVVGHHDADHCRGKVKFVVDDDKMARYLSGAPKKGPNADDPTAACPLDDRTQVADEELEKFADQRVLSYDEKARETHVVMPKGIVRGSGSRHLWSEAVVKGVKYVYFQHPSPPPPTGRSYNDDQRILYRNSWRLRIYAQAVDLDGLRRDDVARMVRFVNVLANKPPSRPWEEIILLVRQEMDYTSGPRPKIKSYTIEHHLQNNTFAAKHGGVWVLKPEQCKDYLVEIEDVTEGDPALHGEWIKSILPRGEEFHKLIEEKELHVLLTTPEQKAAAANKQSQEQPKP